MLVVFGGQSSGRSLWELNAADWSWTNRSAPANGPIQRQYPSMAFDSMRGKLMVFGGRSSVDNLYKQDIWEWSGTDATLTNRTTGGIKPDARYQAGLVYDSMRDRMLLFGGTGTQTYDDLWSWSPTTREWTQISLSGARPIGALRPLDVLRPGARQGVRVRAEPGRLPELGVRPRAEHLEGSDGDVTAGGRVAQLLRRRARHDARQDRDAGRLLQRRLQHGHLGVGHDHRPVGAADARDGHGGARRSLLPRRSRTTRSGAFSCWSAATSRSRAPPVRRNDSWEWDANLLKWNETTPAGVKPRAALPAPDDVQRARAGRPTCSAARSPTTRPTVRRSSGSTCRTRAPGRTAWAAPPGRRPVACRATASTASAARRRPRSAPAPASRATWRGWRGRAPTFRRGCPTTPARAITPATRASSARRCSATPARRSPSARAATAPTASAATPPATAPASSATWRRSAAPARRFRTAIEDPPTCASDDPNSRVLRRHRYLHRRPAGDRQAVHRGRAVHGQQLHRRVLLQHHLRAAPAKAAPGRGRKGRAA